MPFLLNWTYISESLIFWYSDFRNVIQDMTRNSYQIDEGSADCVSYHFPLLMDWKESWIARSFQTTLLRAICFLTYLSFFLLWIWNVVLLLWLLFRRYALYHPYFIFFRDPYRRRKRTSSERGVHANATWKTPCCSCS